MAPLEAAPMPSTSHPLYVRSLAYTCLKPPPLGGPKLGLESDIVGQLRLKVGATWGHFLVLGPV